MDVLNVSEQIILLTNKYSNIILAITISLAASIVQKYEKFIRQT